MAQYILQFPEAADLQSSVFKERPSPFLYLVIMCGVRTQKGTRSSSEQNPQRKH